MKNKKLSSLLSEVNVINISFTVSNEFFAEFINDHFAKNLKGSKRLTNGVCDPRSQPSCINANCQVPGVNTSC